MNRANHVSGSSRTPAGIAEPTVVRRLAAKTEGRGIPLCILVIEDSEEDDKTAQKATGKGTFGMRP
jgi:hypothetical protein